MGRPITSNSPTAIYHRERRRKLKAKAATAPMGRPITSDTPEAIYQRERRARLKAEAAERAEAEASVAVALQPDATMQREPSGREIVDWIEAELVIPSGPLAGQPFRLPDWQTDWVLAALAPDCREAGLSIARKNGKSGKVAAILLAFLCGPGNRPDWRGVVTSLTGTLAKELREAIELTAQASGLDQHLALRKSPPPGSLHGLNKASVKFLAADRATGHAIGSDLAIIDEAGLLQENKRALWNALISSTSGCDGRFWAISIQGDGPMFAEMEERAGAPGMHWQKWSAPDVACALDDRAAWHAANPGLADGIKSEGYMQRMADRALASPGNEAHFRAYDLNQPVDPEKESIVTVREYTDCIVDELPPWGRDIVVGIDLGGTVSMTCAVALCMSTGRLLVRGAFADDPPLSKRAREDRMGSRYDVMVRQGELKLYPGRTTPVVPFLKDFFGEVAGYGNIIAIGADRFRKAELEQALDDAMIPRTRLELRGQGAGSTADGSHDVRAFQRLVRDRVLHTEGSPMLEAAIAGSVLRYDGSGNPALDKANQKSRIDAASAAVIAAGLREVVKPSSGVQITII